MSCTKFPKLYNTNLLQNNQENMCSFLYFFWYTIYSYAFIPLEDPEMSLHPAPEMRYFSDFSP